MTAWLGTIGGTEAIEIDHRGGLGFSGRWSLDWWIGADDRWHDPGVDVAVRQHATPDGAGFETAMRVPGGDAVHRVWAVPGRRSGSVVAVVEIENRSSMPFAVAAVASAPTAGSALELTVADDGIALDGVRVLHAERPAARGAVAADRSGLFTEVAGGRARGELPLLPGRGSGMAAAAIWPLAHTGVLRLVCGSGRDRIDPPDRFDPEAVGRGWRAHLDRGLQLDLPDAALMASVEAARRNLLARAGVAPAAELGAVGRVLADSGHGSEAVFVADRAMGVVDRWMMRPAETDLVALIDIVRSWWRTVELGQRPSVDDALAERVADAVQLVAHHRQAGELAPGTSGALRAAARLLHSAGRDRTAADVLDLAIVAGENGTAEPVEPATDVAVVRGVLDRLVDEHPDGLALVPDYDRSWYGAPIGVTRIPTRHGALSYAVRWHGTRPALLWELERAGPSGPGPITAPGLDPGWVTTDWSGEALLDRPYQLEPNATERAE